MILEHFPKRQLLPFILLIYAFASEGLHGEQTYEWDIDVAYGTEDDRQTLDIIRLTTAADAPVLFFVHGGAWRGGDKVRAITSSLAESMIQRGYVVVSINYRLTPPNTFPENVEDVAAAIAWVYSNIADYGGDPEQLFLLGHSSGAHLASLVAVHAAYLNQHGIGLEVIRGVIALDTQAYDLVELAERSGGQFGLFSVYRQAFSNNPLIWHRASPALQISRDAALPPFAICYTGGATGRTLHERRRQADHFASMLRVNGGNASVLSAIEKSHEQIMDEFGLQDDPVTSRALAAIGAP